MADPLSLSASIIALLQLAGTVVQYLNSAKGASDDRQKIRTEISGTIGTLFLLKDLADRGQWKGDWFITVQSLNLPGGALDKFKAILELLASKLKPAEGAKKIGKALMWPFQKGEINDMLETLERQKSLFSIALQNDHIGLSQAIRTDMTGLHHKIDEVNRGLTQVRMNQAGQETRSQDDEFRQILDWLSPLDFPAQQNDLLSRRQEGTGAWLFESEEFKSWFNGTRQTLFCKGIPGAGKTMLTSILIDYLLKAMKAEDTCVAYFYCTYSNRIEQTPLRILLSLLSQVLRKRQRAPQDLKSLYYKNRGTLPALHEVSKLLHSEVSQNTKTFIIIDALDECNDDDNTLTILLSEIRSLQSVTSLNLMITSRPILKIEHIFQTATKLEIRASDADVQKYIEGQLPRLASCVIRNISLQEKIKHEIVKAVDGMFLLAQLHLDSLTDKTSAKAVKKALEKLPKGSDGLGRAYDGAMERIYSQKPGFRQLAERVLSWITYASRQFTTLELQYALAVEPGESEFDEENLTDIEELVSVCAGLVTIDQGSGMVRLVHHTTQEYLERILPQRYPKAQEDITISCLTYLLSDVFECSIYEDVISGIKEYPLYDYASHTWWTYPVESQSQLAQSLALKFLMDVVRVESTFHVIRDREYSSSPLKFTRNFTGLHFTAAFGLKHLAMLLLESGLDPESRDGSERTALVWAVEKCRESVVRVLIEKGANLDQKQDGIPLLSMATIRGHEGIVALLLKYGANLEGKDDLEEKTPLSWAAEMGHKAVLSYLLEKEAEIDSEDRYKQTPLFCAAAYGHEEVVALLLKNRAGIDSKDQYEQTPLLCAARHGHERAVELLLKNGAAIDSEDRHQRTPLSCAAKNGYEEVVAVLLANGAEVDSKDESGITPLCWALQYRRIGLATILLESGAKLEIKDLYGQTALSWAVKNSVDDVVEFLLDRGADVDTEDNSKRTPLSFAAEFGYTAIISLLIGKGAKPDSKDNAGRTPISWAKDNTIRALLESTLPV